MDVGIFCLCLGNSSASLRSPREKGCWLFLCASVILRASVRKVVILCFLPPAAKGRLLRCPVSRLGLARLFAAAAWLRFRKNRFEECCAAMMTTSPEILNQSVWRLGDGVQRQVRRYHRPPRKPQPLRHHGSGWPTGIPGTSDSC